jgi:hypothetical protein
MRLKREREYLRRVQQTLRLFLQRQRRSGRLLHQRHVLLRVLFKIVYHVTYFANLLRLRTAGLVHRFRDVRDALRCFDDVGDRRAGRVDLPLPPR